MMFSSKLCKKILLMCCVLSLAQSLPQITHASATGGDVMVTPPSTDTPSTPVEPEEEEEEEESLFADIKGHWAEETIVEAVGLGIFVGVDEENFAPDKAMTRAEFIVIMVTQLYPTVDFVDPGTYWYSAYFEVAQAEGIIPSTWREKYLEEKISRQEMAFLLTKTLETPPDQLVKTTVIPDYGLITKNATDDYQTAVLTVYSLGIVGGKQADGSFCPHDSSTRAEGATVMLNFVDEARRVTVEFERDPNEMTDLNRLDLEYTKNRPNMTIDLSDPNRPIAKVGDIVISGKTETKVVAHPSGASYNKMYVPYVAGVALDAGINTNSTHGIVGHNFVGGGVHHNGEAYYINPTTKEGYWASQWEAILKRNPAPIPPGTTDGEVSSNLQWNWSVKQNKWVEGYAYTKGQ